MNRMKLDLQQFAEGAEGAAEAAAPAGTGAESSAAGIGQVRTGDTLGNGQQVQGAQVAAELNRQMKRHPELRKVYGQRPQEAAPQGQQGQAEAQPEKTIQERWEELKKGEYKDLYGQDVQSAIRDRFKNQEDARKQLEELRPMLDAAMKLRGVQTVEDLRKAVLEDDRLYEDEAEAAGMSVESYRTMKGLEEENARYKEAEQRSIEEQMFQDHIQKLAMQAEEMKKIIPGFDLRAELNDPRFRRMTSPEVGISVEDAFYAIHGKEMAAESMRAGMERAEKQMSQTIRAQGMRPVEGAAHGQGQPAAKAPLDFSKMSRSEREKFRSQVMSGKVVISG